MIIATYKQWINGSKYIDGYYEEYTSVYEDKSKLLENLKYWEKSGNPMIISAIWELS